MIAGGSVSGDSKNAHLMQLDGAAESLLLFKADDTSILHHAFISIFIALRAVITHYVTILMPILSYLQGLHEEGECRQLDFWAGKGANIR